MSFLIVGEAWGAQEERERRPFVGAAGQLIRRLLDEAGIEDYAFTNVFNRRPPGNDIGQFCVSRKELPPNYILPPLQRGRYVRPDLIPELLRLYGETLQHSAIIALGNTPLWAFTGSYGIKTYRGTFTYAKALIGCCHEVPLLPTYHPAAVLRQYDLYPIVLMDLMKARQGPAPFTPEIWIEPTIEDLWTFKNLYIDGCELLAFDIETIPAAGVIKCISFAPRPDLALVITPQSYPLPDECRAWRFVKEVLAGPEPKLAQNGLYDIQYLWRKLGIKVNNYAQDTMLLHHAMYPMLPKDLGFLGSIYTNTPAWKQHRSDKAAKRDD